ncbi:MAG TPA: flagellar motor protein MotB [Candidatus Sulfopaludibacter sp.]|nr:flagellar motor protein MotB [Candidatus Sulfopaludibacter sp.]
MSKKKEGHHGGAWKVAYADFTTAMMALFLCLWLASQDQKIKDAVERAFRNPFSSVTKESVGIIPNKEASSTYKQEGRFTSVSAVEMETMRRISDDLSKLLKQQDTEQTSVQIEVTSDGLRINIFDRSQKPIFNPDTALFTDYGAWVFSTLAWEISRYSTFHIELEGHTASEAGSQKPQVKSQTSDLRLPGSDLWDLSTERANAARRKLIQSGVAEVQICKVSGYADTVPMPGYAPDSEINRRVTVLVKLKESVDALPDKPETMDTTTPPNNVPDDTPND